MKAGRWIAGGALGAVLLAGYAVAAPDAAPPGAAALLGGGYLPRGGAPDSLLLNPPPPAPDSAAEARDREAMREAVALRGSARWKQAAIDADLFTRDATATFSCAAGFVISAQTTPKVHALLRRMGADLGLSTYPTKRRYQRARPFMVNNEPTCTPQDEPMLRKDGSYPSGHSAIGWGWGLVLAGLVPDRSAQLVQRGRAFGDSRRVCNVHWLSDVEEGRVAATAVVSRLQAEPAFRADFDAARAELEAVRAKLPKPDCAAENEAFATAAR